MRARPATSAAGTPLAAANAVSLESENIPRAGAGVLHQPQAAEEHQLPWWRRHIDAIASVAGTVVLVLVIPVDALSTGSRVGVFIGIALGVPTVVCVARAVALRRQLDRGAHDR